MSKNPTTAVFSSRLPRGCKLLCKPIASFVEKNRTLTWTIGDINKSKIYLDAMFTIPTTEAIDGTTSENIRKTKINSTISSREKKKCIQ